MVCSYGDACFGCSLALVRCQGDNCLRRLHHICQGEYEGAKVIVSDGVEKKLCRACVDNIFCESVGNGKKERIDVRLKGKGEKGCSVAKDEEEGEACLVSVVPPASIPTSSLPLSSSLCTNPAASQIIAHQLLPRFHENSPAD